MHELYTISDDGYLDYFFHDGQFRGWESMARFLLILAGRQSGKTAFGPPWLYREIQQKGPGDYLVAASTFKLLYIKAIPEIEALFDRTLQLGRYIQTPIQRFVFSRVGLQRAFGVGYHAPTTIYFGHGQDPESLEAATYKAIWLDEAGQKKFKLASWDAVQGRGTTTLARILLTTTPYYLGWLKKKVFDKCGVDPDYELVRFESIENPNFLQAEWDRLQRDLPAWKFDLFYRALWSRPAGLIYDNFLDADTIKRRPIPADWPRYVGLDFGGVNTAALFYARKPDTEPAEFYAYRTYHPREKKTSVQHVAAIRKGEPESLSAVGGAPSEGQWRREFKSAGLVVRRPPIKDVEVGIDRVYAAHAKRQVKVFDDLDNYLDEKGAYSRVLDDFGEPTEKIEDKNEYHLMDCERYLWAELGESRGDGKSEIVLPNDPLDGLEF